MQKKLRSILTVLTVLLYVGASAAIINVTTDITTNTTWTNNNIYILYGDIIVKNGATLTIQPGTIIRGDKSTLSRLVVATSGYIIAQGTPEQPIIFTSNQPVGQRARGDWAGIAICGEAPVNFKNAQGQPIQGRLECGPTADYDYGGNNPDDSSGVLSYVRIEYAGYVCGTNTELNSLTLGGVGRKTKIDHVQVSYGQDDGFEWFGGNVNCNHIISLGSRDDDFDTDNGFSGKVQFGLVVRIDTIADQGDISNAFESDNDANGSYNSPYTSAVFSNITVIGPAATTTSSFDPKYGWALRLRRNTAINVFNSVFLGYKRGLRIEGSATQLKATNDTLEFKNNIIAGWVEQYYESAFDSLYLLTHNSNTIIPGNANTVLNLVQPYHSDLNLRDYRPLAGSQVLSGASFTNPKLSGLTPTSYRGAFNQTDNWASCWAEFTPQDEDYTQVPINYGYTANLNVSGPTTFCQGGSVTLSVTSPVTGLNYAWSNGATTPSINVTTSGTYTVTVTNARGCAKTFSQQVTVNPNPNAPTLTPSATAFCTGNSVTISASPASSYAWSNGQTSSSINVNIGGTYSLTITDANGCTASASVAITQNTPTPATISADGPTTFCTGDSVNISVTNPAAYTSFIWSNNQTGSSIVVVSSGTFSVTTTDVNGCTAASANTITTSVSNSPTPTISANGPTTFCQGGSVVLTSTPGDTYLWSNGATTQSITVTTSGTYSVNVTNTNACAGVGQSNTITVTVTPQPSASFTQSASGNPYTISFTNTSTNATSYLWNFGNGQTSTEPNPTHVYNANGVYTVTLIATNGACTSTYSSTINITGVSVEDITGSLESIKLYPNPNAGSAQLEIYANTNADAVVSIADFTGRTLYQVPVQLYTGTNQIEINTGDFANGMYLVHIQSGKTIRTLRMSVSK
ncbi:MAG: PKD domain-containing protein [Chitinophagales bacterium]|nr:PKD domain-containing protein [Chitinophagales bacterium]MDW8418960.1 PKD domain-containing protein [Chitinophagales bacterium]